MKRERMLLSGNRFDVRIEPNLFAIDTIVLEAMYCRETGFDFIGLEQPGEVAIADVQLCGRTNFVLIDLLHVRVAAIRKTHRPGKIALRAVAAAVEKTPYPPDREAQGDTRRGDIHPTGQWNFLDPSVKHHQRKREDQPAIKRQPAGA